MIYVTIEEKANLISLDFITDDDELFVDNLRDLNTVRFRIKAI